jgi:hypothetical protein
MMTEKEIRARRLRSQRKMKRGKRPPTKLDEIVADAARQEAEGSELSAEEWERIIAGARRYDEPLEEMNPEEWERIIAGARRYDEPLEEVSPELWRMVEQTLYPHRRRAATTPPQNHRKTRKIKARQRTQKR